MAYSDSDYTYAGGELERGPRAGFWRRFGAALIDGILIGLVAGILYAALPSTGYLIGVVGGAAYFTLMEGGRSGQTFGKSALGIRVVSIDTGESIGYASAFVRYVGRIVSSLPLYLGYFWMLWDREKQCWHDKFARSVVVPA
jgi:uncharacterized RDD family membrane protein YckC